MFKKENIEFDLYSFLLFATNIRMRHLHVYLLTHYDGLSRRLSRKLENSKHITCNVIWRLIRKHQPVLFILVFKAGDIAREMGWGYWGWGKRKNIIVHLCCY